jgi:hypothetical protein
MLFKASAFQTDSARLAKRHATNYQRGTRDLNGA